VILGRTAIESDCQPSPDTDDDWVSKATEALEAARLIAAGIEEKSEAMKRAGLLRRPPTYTNHSGEEARQAPKHTYGV